MARLLGLIGLLTWLARASPLPPPCFSNVYCSGPLLHAVQTARIFNDSKTFVDLKMLKSENETLKVFNTLVKQYKNLTRDQLELFVSENFDDGEELLPWTPPDFDPKPPLLAKIKDPAMRQFAEELIAIWPTLARKIGPEVAEHPDRHSLIYLPNGFIVPGGRFKEIYYWDSFWIIDGMIISGMTETAKGMIENFLYMVKKFGHVPNGSRVYYIERSQPPLLTAMVAKYIAATQDLTWLKENIATLEQELEYWMDKRSVEIFKNGQKHVMLRYNAPSTGPRPESYVEDYGAVNSVNIVNDEDRQEFFTDIKSAAESGWDFSSRWFVRPDGSNKGNLSDLHTRKIIPVDLNSIYAAALETIGNLHNRLSNTRAAKKWWFLSRKWRKSIDSLLWNEADGIWYDYNAERGEQRKYFYLMNVAPLWAKVVNSEDHLEHSLKVIKYLKSNAALRYAGGIPASVDRTGEQWDFPNAWPPLQSMLVQALVNTYLPRGKAMAWELAQLWVRANYKGYKKSDQMFEKYDAELPGEYGGGGEYVVQKGFGWTNGIVLELLNQFGQELKAEEPFVDQITAR